MIGVPRLDGRVIASGNAAWHGLAVLPQPDQRGGVARIGVGVALRRAASARGEMRDGRADAAGEHALRVA